MERQYIPEIGRHVKLSLFADYATHGIAHTWASLEVLSITGNMVTVEVLNGSVKTGQQVSVPLEIIEKPLGWEPRYTIYVKPTGVDKVLSWFSRGIAVWQTHYMNPRSMPKVCLPLDEGSPGWRFPERTDAIQPEDCAKLIRLVKFEEIECTDELQKLDSPKAKKKQIAEWLKDGWKTEYIRHGSYWRRVKETVVHDWQE